MRIYGMRVTNWTSFRFAIGVEVLYRQLRKERPGLTRQAFHVMATAVAEEIVDSGNGDDLISPSVLVSRIRDKAKSAGY